MNCGKARHSLTHKVKGFSRKYSIKRKVSWDTNKFLWCLIGNIAGDFESLCLVNSLVYHLVREDLKDIW